MKAFFNGLRLVFLAGLAGCSSPGDRASEAGAIRLTAHMVSPVDITLEWHDPQGDAAGYVVEYTNDPKDEYVPLGHLPASCTNFSHSRLLQQTMFYYRVRAYYGPASRPVEVSLPETLTDEAYVTGFALPEDYSWAGPVIVPATGPVDRFSIRQPSMAANAAPSDLKAQLMTVLTVSGFRLTWTDHSNDEEGFLLERQPPGSSEYEVCALVETNVNAFGWAFEPPQRKGNFRIRAFYYGEASNVVVKQTGKDPELAHW